MRRVLIITYYWPPGGGAGVQRWLKFAKYLRAYGWEPVIYTPENGEMPVLDLSLEKDIPANLEVLRRPIWEPYNSYKRFVGQKKEEKINTGFLTEHQKPKRAEKIAVWIRGNFFIPDARKFWIKPSVRFLTHYLNQHPVQAVISTGPPHSMHLIALQLRQKLGIPWLADFRDPWTNIDFYPELMLTPSSDRKHREMEKAVLGKADAVVSIGKMMSDEFVGILGKQPEKFSVIGNGFDPDDLYKGTVVADTKFSLAHIGTLVKSRNPVVLWKVLAGLVQQDAGFAADLCIKLVGKVDVNVSQSLAEKGLTSFVQKIEYLPHSDVIREQQQSQVLLLLVNNTRNAAGILTSKFYEYLSANRPIICIGPEQGEIGDVFRETNCGKISGFEEEEQLRKNITEYYTAFKAGKLVSAAQGIEQFSRKALTGKIAEVLEQIAS
ncbi:MAG TPA: glycosyltransferase [Bacteroidia bacterium]|nr:glycosyltransferase [Bacteroidia bacterium]